MTWTLLLYTSQSQPPSDEARQSAIAHHRKVQHEMEAHGILHEAVQLAQLHTAHTVRQSHETLDVTDSPCMETKEWLVGFYILDCDDHDTALSYARKLAGPFTSVEVRPIAWRKTR